MSETIQDVERILKELSDSLTARRFLQSDIAKKKILEHHITWNEDHEKINEHHMMNTLEESIHYHVDMPDSIDQYIKEEKEPSE